MLKFYYERRYFSPYMSFIKLPGCFSVLLGTIQLFKFSLYANLHSLTSAFEMFLGELTSIIFSWPKVHLGFSVTSQGNSNFLAYPIFDSRSSLMKQIMKQNFGAQVPASWLEMGTISLVVSDVLITLVMWSWCNGQKFRQW